MKFKQIISILVICQLVIVPTNIAWGKGYCDDSEEGYTTDTPEGYKLEADFTDAKAACDDDPTYCWKPSTNTCVKNQTRIDSQDALRDGYMDGDSSFCDSIEDSDKAETCRTQSTDACKDEEDEDERKECMDNFAKNYATSQDFIDMGLEGENFGEYTIIALTSIILLMSYIATKSYGIKFFGKCMDRNIFNVTSLAVMAHEVYTYTMVNEEFKAMISAYEESGETDAYSTQLAAFEFLKTQQDKVTEVAQIKSVVYGLAATGYFASTVAALAYLAPPPHTGCIETPVGMHNRNPLENTDTKFASIDQTTNSTDLLFLYQERGSFFNGNTHSPTLSEYNSVKEKQFLETLTNENKQQFDLGIKNAIRFTSDVSLRLLSYIVPSAHANLIEDVCKDGGCDTEGFDDLYVMLIVAASGAAIGGILGGFAKAYIDFANGLNSAGSVIIAIAGVVVGGFATYVALGSAERHEQSKANSEILTEVIEDFEASLEGYCSNGHDDINNPRCYCYDDKGDPLENRSNSETCTALYARDQYQMELIQAKEYGSTADSPKGCVRISGQQDYNCKCKKGTGQNACMKAHPGTAVSFNGIGAGINITPALDYYNETLSGTHGSGSFNPSTAMNYAAKTKKRAKQMYSQIGKALTGDAKKQFQAAGKAVPQMLKKIMQNPEFKKRTQNSQAAMGSSTGSAPKKGRLAGALKKALKKTGLKRKGSKVTYGGSRTKRAADKKKGVSFNFDDDIAASSSAKVEHFQDKKYKYKHNDIVKNEGVSIWRVLSNRYNQSGLRRLFGDE